LRKIGLSLGVPSISWQDLRNVYKKFAVEFICKPYSTWAADGSSRDSTGLATTLPLPKSLSRPSVKAMDRSGPRISNATRHRVRPAAGS
jgi:hypothetical protein